MNLKWIELYPDFQVDVPQPCGKLREGRLKADKAKELQEALDAEQQTVAKETRVYVTIADCSSHQNYGFENMEAFSQNMDKSVAERIQMLAREGITSVSDVKSAFTIMCTTYFLRTRRSLMAAAGPFSQHFVTSATRSKLCLRKTATAQLIKRMLES
ncbi:uncharacterized protein LOC142799707 [Rhipicephalus microplus]